MAKQDEYIRITTRILPELRDALVEQAKRTERSRNGELIAMVQAGLGLADGEPRPYTEEDVKHFLARESASGKYSVSTTQALIALIEAMPEEKRKALLKLLA